MPARDVKEYQREYYQKVRKPKLHALGVKKPRKSTKVKLVCQGEDCSNIFYDYKNRAAERKYCSAECKNKAIALFHQTGRVVGNKKLCLDCKEWKDLATGYYYNKRPGKPPVAYSRCKKCHNRFCVTWRRENPDKWQPIADRAKQRYYLYQTTGVEKYKPVGSGNHGHTGNRTRWRKTMLFNLEKGRFTQIPKHAFKPYTGVSWQPETAKLVRVRFKAVDWQED